MEYEGQRREGECESCYKRWERECEATASCDDCGQSVEVEEELEVE